MARNPKEFEDIKNKLARHLKEDGVGDIKAAFDNDPKRFEKFSLTLDDLLLDFSKQAINEKTLSLLIALAKCADVEGARLQMFTGADINVSENRAVLHSLLRMPRDEKFVLNGQDLGGQVHAMLDKMARFSCAVRTGQKKGATGKAFKDVVNIGIGGSHLGPMMTYRALRPYCDGPRVHFVSNVDGADIADCLSELNPETTLIIVASKTFTTAETMLNAQIARQWLVAKLGEDSVLSHFAAISSAQNKAEEFGIDGDHVFGFWQWVGGRTSIWSAIGLPLMLAIGAENFAAFLAGAFDMDNHFCQTPMAQNLPIIMALIGFWQRTICQYPTRAIIPYAARLEHFVAYMQQLDMESNGKSVSLEGKPLTTPTGPVVWGGCGSDAQHAFFQLLHQGSDIIGVEFIAFVKTHEPKLLKSQQALLANCLAQSQALMEGRSRQESLARLKAKGMGEPQAEALSAYQQFAGNRPSLTIMQEQLSPYSLGRLIALYEHRVFVEGVLYDIDSFDQWGVELGKELAQKILPRLTHDGVEVATDSSTQGLITYINQMMKAKR